jgi:hypothetical protein
MRSLEYEPRAGRERRRPQWLLSIALAVAAVATWCAWKWQLKVDAREFSAQATMVTTQRLVIFRQPPTRGSLRHLARQRGQWALWLEWHGKSLPEARDVLRGRSFDNVNQLCLYIWDDIGPWLHEIARPDTGFRRVKSISFPQTEATDQCLIDLARSDTGLASVTELCFSRTRVTDAGLRELARADTGLKGLKCIYVGSRFITDVGLREISGPNTGLKALTFLDLTSSSVTDGGLMQLARPDCGLTNLSFVSVQWTTITEEAIGTLMKARPCLRVSK